jgi:hypothetical protein
MGDIFNCRNEEDRKKKIIFIIDPNGVLSNIRLSRLKYSFESASASSGIPNSSFITIQ